MTSDYYLKDTKVENKNHPNGLPSNKENRTKSKRSKSGYSSSQLEKPAALLSKWFGPHILELHCTFVVPTTYNSTLLYPGGAGGSTQLKMQ